MISGKAIARALRGQFLIDSALRIRRLRRLFPQNPVYDIEIPENTSNSDTDTVSITAGETLTEEDVKELEKLYDELGDKDLDSTKIDDVPSLRKLRRIPETHKEEIAKQSRTAKLWVQYMDYVDVIKMFIRAERTGDWDKHLVATEKMLNLYAATGHYHYAKSARLYLQRMLKLKDNYPWLYQKLKENWYHCVRRTNKFWAGLWTDLT